MCCSPYMYPYWCCRPFWPAPIPPRPPVPPFPPPFPPMRVAVAQLTNTEGGTYAASADIPVDTTAVNTGGPSIVLSGTGAILQGPPIPPPFPGGGAAILPEGLYYVQYNVTLFNPSTSETQAVSVALEVDGTQSVISTARGTLLASEYRTLGSGTFVPVTAGTTATVNLANYSAASVTASNIQLLIFRVA